ncbi:Galactose-1-phosphate [Hortaea werneckii]|nr:Galactose-1-phosphate [Hortaea werneckii]
MPDAILDDISHRRYNALRGSWVLVSPHRTKRPWQGQQEAASKIELPEYDPSVCTSVRAVWHGQVIDKESSATYVPVIREPKATKGATSGIQPTKPRRLVGIKASEGRKHNRQMLCYHVLAQSQCYVGRHASSEHIACHRYVDQTIHLTPGPAIAAVKNVKTNHTATIGAKRQHCRTAEPTVPLHANLREQGPGHGLLELENLQKYHREQGGAHLLEDYAKLESEKGERTVFENSSFWAGCPWWATWPFEIMVVAKQHKRALVDFDQQNRDDLAEVVSEITRIYDNLFETSFPYSMGIHQAPLTGTDEEIEASHFHMHFYPPLLRSATVRKFLVGYEMMAEPQRDITPEQAAQRLRGCNGELYRKKL